MMNSSEDFNNVMGEWTEDENPLQDSFKIKVINIVFNTSSYAIIQWKINDFNFRIIFRKLIIFKTIFCI